MSEFMQPVRPMRIVITGEQALYFMPVFAVRVIDNKAEYLTVDGAFYSPADLAFSEVLIDGQWTAVKSVARYQS